VRIPPEELGLGVSGQRGESKQASCVDPRQRPIRIRRHAAILSQQLPEPSDAATSGVRHVRAPLQPVIRRPKTMQKGWPTGSVKTRKPVSRSSGIRMAPRTSISCNPAKHVQISVFWCNETVHARGEKAAHIGGGVRVLPGLLQHSA
jgi:hypothetical protein